MARSVILFLAANPIGGGRVAFDLECNEIERELSRSKLRHAFEFRSKWAVKVDDVSSHVMETQPTIIHFTGCGDANGLVLEGEDGRPQSMKPAALAQLIGSTADRARIVLLNACDSERQARALSDTVGCAIGMGGAIGDADARAFAVGFYRALGDGRSVGNAFEQAMAALACKDLPGQAHPRCLVRADRDAATLTLHDLDADPSPAPPAAPGGPELFLACPSGSKASAVALYDLLRSEVSMFFAERSLQPEDRWDEAVPAAQRASRTTVLLASSRADPAWYLGREVLTAIALQRASAGAHRLVVVCLEPGLTVPCGLGPMDVIDAVEAGGLAGVAARLRARVLPLRKDPAARTPLPVDSVPDGWKPPCDGLRLHERLSRLREPMLERIVANAGIDGARIGPRAAALSDRTLSLAQLAALDPGLHRRIVIELDQCAPWTVR